MRLFACPSCSQVVYFENVVCERCNHALGYDPRKNAMHALEGGTDGVWTSVGARGAGDEWRYCANYDQSVCNWLVPAAEGGFCDCCRHNLVVPNTADAQNLDQWRRMEVAKRRLFYTIFRLNLPRETRAENPEGLGFQFLSEDPNLAGQVMTGHDDGLITIALVEADDAERERRRHTMGEPYRTLLGHFRHEIGHWYWDRLVRDAGLLEECRAVFGDDSVDYDEALQAHYANGPKVGWQDAFVSSYAAVHPWEDFAETWAHYFHITDTLDTARALGFKVDPRVDKEDAISTEADFDVYAARVTIGDIATSWFATAAALNMLNRSIGIGDAYPFVLADPVIRKLGFIHDLVHGRIAKRQAA